MDCLYVYAALHLFQNLCKDLINIFRICVLHQELQRLVIMCWGTFGDITLYRHMTSILKIGHQNDT